MDVLTLETGENEWIRSTQKQVANLRGLVGELIYLSRLDEEDAKLQKTEVDLSKLVAESAEPFVGMAEFAGKMLNVDVEDGVHMTGDGTMLGRLVSILCDNAVKYAPEGDTIAVILARSRKGIMLITDNAVLQPMSDETLRHLFDRFYRADASRSRESGGYGIGLSVARAIAEKHGGSIRVRQTPEGRVRFECMLGK
jgi:signal transduction histidine kinase